MKRVFFTICTAALLFSSCQKEIEQINVINNKQVISFVSESSVDTKSSMNIDGTKVKYSWTEEDQDFHVFYGENQADPVEVSLNENILSLKASFDEGVLPSSGEVSFTGYLNGSIKSEQTMPAMGGTYDPTADVMIARATTDASQLGSPIVFQYKRMVSVVKLTLQDMPSKANQITVSADKQIVGTCDQNGDWTLNDGSIVVKGIGEDNVVYFTLAPNKNVSLTIFAETEEDGNFIGTTAMKDFNSGNVRGLKVSMSSADQEITVTKTITELYEAKGWVASSGTDINTIATSFKLDGIITVSTSGEANCGSLWGTAPNIDWRLYENKNGNITISAASGYEIVSATITYSTYYTGVLKDSAGNNVASKTVIPVSGNSITLTVGNSGTKTNGQVRVTNISVIYKSTNTGLLEKTTAPTLTEDALFTTSLFNVVITNNEAGAVVYYTTDGSEPTTSSDSFTEGTKTIEITSTTTVKAIAVAEGKRDSDVVSATYTYEAPIANTAATAYTTKEAIALIDANNSQLDTVEVYVKGIISKVQSYNSSYGSITYWLDDDTFEVYGGLGFDKAKFVSETDLHVGDTVVVKGLVKKYDSIYEMNQNSILVSLDPSTSKAAPTLTITGNKLTMKVGDSNNVFTASYSGDGELSVASSDSTVASVSLSGPSAEGVYTVEVEAKNSGNVTITLSAAETDNYFRILRRYQLAVSKSGEVSFTVGSGKEFSSNAGTTKEYITISATDGTSTVNNWGSTTYVRLQAGGTIVVTPNDVTINKIVFTCTSSYEKTWSASVGDAPVIDTEAHTVTWTGSSSNAITFTNTATSQSRISNIVVTYN